MIERIDGIDCLRALMSVFVVAWHMKIAGDSLAYPRGEYFNHTLTVSDFVNFHVLLLAVPTFIFLSNYLYVVKGATTSDLGKRIKRLAVLLTFWPIAWILYSKGYHGLSDLIPHSLSSLLTTLLRAGHTIYYFFVSLMICLLVTRIAASCAVRVQMLSFLGSAALLSCLPQLSVASGYYHLSAYWSPVNFIPFSFGAVLVAKNRDYIRSHRTAILGFLIILSFVFSKIEWNFSAGDMYFPGDGYSIPPYTRTSLVFAVTALCIIALEAQVTANVVIKFMARHALALYCLHLFVKEPIQGFLSKMSQHHLVVSFGSLVLVIVASYAIAIVLRIYLREEVIM